MPVNVNDIEPEEKIIEIEMERLRSFRNHPFKVKADAEMLLLIESIGKYGVMNPLIVRPVPEGVYDLFDRMKAGNTYKEDCIVPREDLRYLLVLHKDIEGNTHQGEMVVHKLIAEDVLEIFEKLYDAGYPIERMVLPDNYLADDEIMMRDNNSSSFN